VTQRDRRRLLLPLALLATFCALRIAGWLTAPVLEEHDSAVYLEEARQLANAPLRGLAGLSADSSPLYPWLTAILSFATPSLESAARLCSLLFSGLACGLVVAFARFTGDRLGAWIGAMLFACAPLAISFSYSILSEPTYVGLVLAGWWLTLLGSERQGAGVASAIAAGLAFGCAFLTRFEGVMYLLLAPIALVIGALARRERFAEIPRRYAAWLGAFVAAFILVSAPQVLRVSAELGTFALNGRELWWDILHVDDGRSYEQKLYGLDHSPREINLSYLQSHPEARPTSAEQAPLAENLEIWADNWLRFYSTELGVLFGPAALGLFLAGLFALVRERRWAFLAQSGLFITASAAAPLLATALPRHFLVLMPIVLLIAGTGARWLAAELVMAVNRRLTAGAAALTLAVVVVILWTPLHAKTFLRPDSPFYPADYAPSANVVQAWRNSHAGAEPVVAARQRYLAYMTQSEHLPLPYTGLPGLLGYLRANRAHFLFVEMRSSDDRPFVEELLPPNTPPDGLRIVNRNTDRWGRELYLFAVDATAGADDACTRTPVVFIHGLGQGPAIFDALMAYLVSRGYPASCLVALDVQPSNGSNVQAAERTLAPAIDRVRTRDAVEAHSTSTCGKVHLVAHSMGALAARWYATRIRPEAVASLITTSGANHGTNWRCESPMGPGHTEMCPAFAGSRAESEVQFALNGAPGFDVDETPWGIGPDSPGVKSIPPAIGRRIAYATLRSPDDPFIVPAESLSLDGAGGHRLLSRVPGVEESSRGNFVMRDAPGHDALLESHAAMRLIEELIRVSEADQCDP
jgi:4-amino-4-deoxy-L-arabinose transferase-like glycosyltransferase/pimeloyl-ACP methyl ester carboxylesterase